VIRHRETGYLCETTPASIRQAIVEVFANDELRARMGNAARQYILQNMTLDHAVEEELAILEELAVAGW
jgi:glycosyltransferase involved in cell wall biosynthesis